MKAVSVRQPWAFSIFLPANTKDVENRTWRTNYRGRVLIHASAKMDNLDRYREVVRRIAPALLENISFDDLMQGALIGTVEIYDVVENSPSKWAFEHMHHWLLRKPRLFGRAIPWKGAQGLFEVPDAVVAANS